MSIDVSPDVMSEIQRQLATGAYSSHDQLLREALAALRDREQETYGMQDSIDEMEPPNVVPVEQAIREAIEDLKAGRYRPADEVSREIDRKFNFHGE